MLVVMMHTLMGMNAVGFENSQFIENLFLGLSKTIMANGTLTMQTYFAISGFLLTLTLTTEINKIKIA